jgi:hypothetical protein
VSGRARTSGLTGTGGTTTGSTGATEPTGGAEETAAIDCSEFLDQPVASPETKITIRNARSTPIALRSICSHGVFAIEGPDGSTYPLVAFDIACHDQVEDNTCHAYAAPDGCAPELEALVFLDPGQEFTDSWHGSMVHTRALPEVCRGEPTPFVSDPAACATCKQQGPALPGSHEVVVAALIDVDCDADACTVNDSSASLETRVEFVPPVASLAVTVE